MANSFLRKIILEELQNVLKEEGEFGVDTPYGSSEKMSMGPAPSKKAGRVGNPKVEKLQNILNGVGFNVGKPDGIPGPLLFKGLAQLTGVSPQQVAKDFGSGGADNFITLLSDPRQLAALRKANVKKVVDKSTAPIEKIMGTKSVSATPALPVKTQPASPLTAPVEKIPGIEKTTFTRDPEATKIKYKKEEEPVKPKLSGLDETIANEIKKLLKNF